MVPVVQRHTRSYNHASQLASIMSLSGCALNRLQLNVAKTEILWSATSRRLHQLPQAPLRAGTDFVTPSTAVRDLGIHLDSDMSMSSHVCKTVSACFAMLRQLRSIRRSVSRPVVQSLVTSLVRHLSSVVWTTVTRHWPVFLNILFGGSSQW